MEGGGGRSEGRHALLPQDGTVVVPGCHSPNEQVKQPYTTVAVIERANALQQLPAADKGGRATYKKLKTRTAARSIQGSSIKRDALAVSEACAHWEKVVGVGWWEADTGQRTKCGSPPGRAGHIWFACTL